MLPHLILRDHLPGLRQHLTVKSLWQAIILRGKPLSEIEPPRIVRDACCDSLHFVPVQCHARGCLDDRSKLLLLVSSRRSRSPFATSVIPPEYSGLLSPSMMVRSKSLTQTFSCFVAQWSARPKKRRCRQLTKRNSTPSTFSERRTFGVLTVTIN